MSATLNAPTATDALYTLSDPADQGVTFFLDAMHRPFALSPLFQSFHGPGFSRGYMTAVRELHALIAAFEVRFQNHFQFTRMVPASEEEARHGKHLAEETLNSEIARLDERWRTEHLPRLQDIYLRLREISAAYLDQAPSRATVDELLSLYEEIWTIHFRITFPMMGAMQLFDEFYVELFGTEADAHALTAGLPSRSVATGIALTDLAQMARSLGLAEFLSQTTPASLLARLHESEAGREFLRQFERFLDEDGMRQDHPDFMLPTWQEQPASALASIRGYLENGRDNRLEHEQRIQQAEAAIANARQALDSYPEAVRSQFESLLQHARTGAFLQEEHNFYIDQEGPARFRLVLLRLGKFLSRAETIDEPEDIFMLHAEELRAGLARETADLRPVVEERRASFAASQHTIPPPFIGTPPDGAAPPDTLSTRASARFFGGPPQESGDPNVIKGTAGSRGSVSGTAFVARTLEEATAIKPGQILVTVTTMPPWTPLFGIATAIVAETGGPLSHCAIVAREYGVPAVVGAHGATQRIESGQSITVDGTTGMVTIHH